MRAPPESLRPITGAPTFIAWSMILQIFSAWASRKRAAEHGEILAEHEHQPAVDRAPAGHHAVAGDLLLGHAEIARAVLDEHVPFLERALVEQHLEALARGELALAVLRLDAALAAAGPRRRRAFPRAGAGCPAWRRTMSEGGIGRNPGVVGPSCPVAVASPGGRRQSLLRPRAAPETAPPPRVRPGFPPAAPWPRHPRPSARSGSWHRARRPRRRRPRPAVPRPAPGR